MCFTLFDISVAPVITGAWGFGTPETTPRKGGGRRQATGTGRYDTGVSAMRGEEDEDTDSR